MCCLGERRVSAEQIARVLESEFFQWKTDTGQLELPASLH